MDKRNIITIDIGASKIRFMAGNERKELTEYLDTSPVNLVGWEINNQELIKLLADNIRSLINDIQKEGNEVSAISIGSPGSLDPVKGIILTPPNLKGIRHLAVVDELKHIFNLPTFLLNDADASVLGEWWLREHKKFKDIVYITLSTGVGSGILKNHQLLEKKLELGHQPLAIEYAQRLCSCGELNHAEAFLGTQGLSKTYSDIFEIKTDLKPEEQHLISPQMRRGIANSDPRWRAVQEMYTDHLAVFLKNIFLDFRPELIILGGGIIFGNKSLLKQAKEKLKRLVPDEVSNIELALSDNNVNLGAAKYALEQLKG